MAFGLTLPSRLRWQLLLRRQDPWLLAALVACLIGAAVQWIVRPAIERQAHSLQNRLAGRTSQRSVLPAANLEEERLLAFRERLGDDAERTEVLKTLFAEAATLGISLQQGDYARVVDADGEFSKLQIALPMKGSYAQVRAYVRAVLETIPALSLDEISFRRDSAKNPTVEARLRLSLYLKGEDRP